MFSLWTSAAGVPECSSLLMPAFFYGFSVLPFLEEGNLGHTQLWERGVCPWILAEGVRAPPLESRAFWMKILLKEDLASSSDIKVESS